MHQVIAPRNVLLAAALMSLLFLSADSASAQAGASSGAAARMVEAGRYAEARPILLEIVAREPQNADAAFWAGRALLGLGEADAAARHLEQATRREPARADYQLWFGRALGVQAQNAGTLRQPGLARRTKAAFERVLELDADNLDARSHLIDFHLLAPGIMGGRKQTALALAGEIRQRNEYRGLLELARVQLAMDRRADAEQSMHAVIRAYPDSTSPRMTLALHYIEQHRHDHAFQTLQPLAERNPPMRSAQYQLGRLAAVSGSYLDEGERALRSYLRATPTTEELPAHAAHWRLGMILEHRGNTAGARAEYETALRLDPNYDPARQALRRLR
jgi:tetratricopeptide (TPR) repeat protein